MSFDSFLTSGYSPGNPYQGLDLTAAFDRRASLKARAGRPTSTEAV
jgi:hypothetical protein